MSIAARMLLSGAMTLVTLIAMTIFLYLLARSSDTQVEQRHAAALAVVETERILSDLKDAEAAQRGYLLTGIEAYLAPYRNASASLLRRIENLDRRPAGCPGCRERFARLYEVGKARLDIIQQTIDVMQAEGPDAARTLVLADHGRALMDEARTIVGEIAAIEQTVMQDRQIHLDEMRVLHITGLLAGSALVGMTSVVTGLLLLYSLNRSFSALGRGIERISKGDLVTEVAIDGRDELGRLARAFNGMMAELRAAKESRDLAEWTVAGTELALRARSAEVERRTTLIDNFAKMANRLHGCTDEAEFVDVVCRFVPQVLQKLPGAVYAFGNSRNLLRRIAAWGDPRSAPTEFLNAECWGLRRGRPHNVDNAATDTICAHVSIEAVGSYRCRPLVAQGETVGLLYLEQCGATEVDDRDLAFLTETLAFSLVNLRLRNRLRNQSIRDPLTGLFNRRYLEESLELEWARTSRSSTELSVMMADIDHFKKVNDALGHDAGDLVLKQVATLLRQNVREGDVVCRYGGEEFALILPTARLDQAAELADRIRAAISELAITYRGQKLGPITMSFGVASRHDGETPAMLIDMADAALYAAKRAGRNTVRQTTAVTSMAGSA
ncbi:MAG: diguanylate cyclase [Ferrovibrionaceae bacterium]